MAFLARSEGGKVEGLRPIVGDDLTGGSPSAQASPARAGLLRSQGRGGRCSSGAGAKGFAGGARVGSSRDGCLCGRRRRFCGPRASQAAKRRAGIRKMAKGESRRQETGEVHVTQSLDLARPSARAKLLVATEDMGTRQRGGGVCVGDTRRCAGDMRVLDGRLE